MLKVHVRRLCGAGVAGLVLVVLASTPLMTRSADQEATVSSKAPSADVDHPVALAVGEIVKGRLANIDEGGKSHYWLVSLAPGDYKLVVDVRRSDGSDSNVGGMLEWYTTAGERMQEVGRINEIDDKTRGVFGFTVKTPFRAVLRYSNSFTVADYWLGLLAAKSAVVTPFFSSPPAVRPLVLGQSVTAQLNGEQPGARDAYYAIRLGAGDYRIVTEYRRSDGRNSNVGGSTFALDEDGRVQQHLNVANEINPFARKVSTLSLADDAKVMFKTRATFAQEEVVLRVEAAK